MTALAQAQVDGTILIKWVYVTDGKTIYTIRIC